MLDRGACSTLAVAEVPVVTVDRAVGIARSARVETHGKGSRADALIDGDDRNGRRVGRHGARGRGAGAVIVGNREAKDERPTGGVLVRDLRAGCGSAVTEVPLEARNGSVRIGGGPGVG